MNGVVVGQPRHPYHGGTLYFRQPHGEAIFFVALIVAAVIWAAWLSLRRCECDEDERT